MRKSFSLWLCAGSFLAGCAGPIAETKETWDPMAVAWASGKGNAQVTGSAVIQTQGGIPRSCAGKEVSLAPVSKYSTERMKAFYASDVKGYRRAAPDVTTLPKMDPAAEAAIRKETCDAQGNFQFDDVPAGEHYLTTVILWTVGNNIFPEGGALMQRVKVEEGARKRVVLSP